MFARLAAASASRVGSPMRSLFTASAPRLAATPVRSLLVSSAPRVATTPVRTLLTASAPRVATTSAPRVAAPVRSFHASRTALAENPRSNTFVLDSYIVKEWSEIPKAGIHGTNRSKAIWSIWYSPAVTPLYAVIGLATAVMCWFLYRYFAKHTEIAWSKSVRATYDHSGMSDSRSASHVNRLMYPGIKNVIGYDITIFPFKFVSFKNIKERHMVPGMERD